MGDAPTAPPAKRPAVPPGTAPKKKTAPLPSTVAVTPTPGKKKGPSPGAPKAAAAAATATAAVQRAPKKNPDGVAKVMKNTISLAAARHQKTGSSSTPMGTNVALMAVSADLHGRLVANPTEASLLVAKDLASVQIAEQQLTEKIVQQSFAAGAVAQAVAKKKIGEKGTKPASASSSLPSVQVTPPSSALGTTEHKIFTRPMHGLGNSIPTPSAQTSVAATVTPDASHSTGLFLEVSRDDAIMGTRLTQIDLDPEKIAKLVDSSAANVITMLRPDLTPVVPRESAVVSTLAHGALQATVSEATSSNSINTLLNSSQGDRAATGRAKRKRATAVQSDDEDDEEDRDTSNADDDEPGAAAAAAAEVADPDAMDVDKPPLEVRKGIYGVHYVPAVSSAKKRVSLPKRTSAVPTGAVILQDPSHLAGAAHRELQGDVARNKKQLMTKTADISRQLHGTVSAVVETPAMVPQQTFQSVALMLSELFVTGGVQTEPTDSPAYKASKAVEPFELSISSNDAKHLISTFDTDRQLQLFDEKLKAAYRDQLAADCVSLWDMFDEDVLEEVYRAIQESNDTGLLTGGIDLGSIIYQSSIAPKKKPTGNKTRPADATPAQGNVAEKQNMFELDQKHHRQVVEELSRYNPVFKAIRSQEEKMVRLDRPCYSNREKKLADDLLARGELPSVPTLSIAYIDTFKESRRPIQVVKDSTFYCDNGLDCVLRLVGIGQSGGSFYSSKVHSGFTPLNTLAKASKGKAGIGVSVSASGASTVTATFDDAKMRSHVFQNASSGAVPLVRSDLAERLLTACMRPVALSKMTHESRLQLAQTLMKASQTDNELSDLLDGRAMETGYAPKETVGWTADEGYIGTQFLLPREQEELRIWKADPSNRPNPLLKENRDGMCYFCYMCEVNKRNSETVQGIAYDRHATRVNLNIHEENGHFLPLNKFQVEVDNVNGYPREACISPSARSPGKNMIVGHFPIFILNNLWIKATPEHLVIQDTGANFCLSLDK